MLRLLITVGGLTLVLAAGVVSSVLPESTPRPTIDELSRRIEVAQSLIRQERTLIFQMAEYDRTGRAYGRPHEGYDAKSGEQRIKQLEAAIEAWRSEMMLNISVLE